MPHYDHLIIGGGMTAASAAQAIRDARPGDSIGIISADSNPPYDRPPLSKGLWKGDAEGDVFRGVEKLDVTLHLASRARSIDPAAHTASDEAGVIHSYGKLLLATGGTPRQLEHAPDGVIYFRSFDDYRHLREQVRPGARAAVIGGGFIGSEMAAALAMNDVKTAMIFPEAGIGARVYPRALSEFIGGYYGERGVELLSGESLSGVERNGAAYRLSTESGKFVDADIVIAGLGITPNVDLAQQAGITVDNGIVVDRFLQTSAEGVYAAGDVANFENPALGKRLRVEHEDNANTMGAAAGRNMAGEPTPYDHLPYFYSDLFDLGYEAVGELDARHTMVEDWKTPFEEGVIYYLAEGRVRGVLLWNVWDQVDAARELIAAPGPWTESALRGRIS